MGEVDLRRTMGECPDMVSGERELVLRREKSGIKRIHVPAHYN